MFLASLCFGLAVASLFAVRCFRAAAEKDARSFGVLSFWLACMFAGVVSFFYFFVSAIKLALAV